MNKYIAIAALALVLSASAAHAEYTGNGAISSGSSTGASGTDEHAGTEARKRLKEDWDKLKENHAQTWDKLEAARRAHWHVPNLLHKAEGGDSAASPDAGSGEPPEASGEAPVNAGDNAAGASKWEKFKANHQDQKASGEGHLEAAKENAHTGIQHWKDEHKDTLANAKEKAEQWKEDHKEGIAALKEKLHFHHKDQ
jgi:hypothetical protein